MAQPAGIAAAYIERQSLRDAVAMSMTLERLVVGGIAMVRSKSSDFDDGLSLTKALLDYRVPGYAGDI
jgi:hypothetical protein